jgi:hypothetical protein
MPAEVRNDIDRTLDISTWLEIYRPTLQIP